MPVSADQIRALMALGIDQNTMLEIVTIFERDASRDGRDGKASAADRARRYRARQRENGGMAASVSRESVTQTSCDASRSKRDGTLTILPSFLADSQLHSEEVRKKKERAPRKIALPLPSDFEAKLSHHAAADRLKLPAGTVEQKLEDMKVWAQSNGTRKADWDATLHGFLRRAAENHGVSNGHGRSSPLHDDSRSASRAAGRLAEAAERGQFTFGPRPSLLPAESADGLKLLSKG